MSNVIPCERNNLNAQKTGRSDRSAAGIHPANQYHNCVLHGCFGDSQIGIAELTNHSLCRNAMQSAATSIVANRFGMPIGMRKHQLSSTLRPHNR
jgi:hypothetical protein